YITTQSISRYSWRDFAAHCIYLSIYQYILIQMDANVPLDKECSTEDNHLNMIDNIETPQSTQNEDGLNSPTRKLSKISIESPLYKLKVVARSDAPVPSPMKGPKSKWKKCYTQGVQRSISAGKIEPPTRSNLRRSPSMNEMLTVDSNNKENETLTTNILNLTTTVKKNNTNQSEEQIKTSLKRKIISPLSTVQSKSEAQAKFLATSQQQRNTLENNERFTSTTSSLINSVMRSPDTTRLAKRVALNKTDKEVPQYPRQIKTALKFIF
ncbi:developmentally-regulated protein, partial [Acrasis kona]